MNLKLTDLNRRTLAMAAVLLPLLAAFIYVGLRAGPLAPVPVTTTTVTEKSITPSLFGIGTVEARATHRIGPTLAGRLKRVNVEAGDRVTAGQVLAEMEPVDLDDRLAAQSAGLQRAEASIEAAAAQVQEVAAKQGFAEKQVQRYESLFASQMVSNEAVALKRQEALASQAALNAARANVEAARRDRQRLLDERNGLGQQRQHLLLRAPVSGVVIQRNADPGSTVVAGQAVVEVVEHGGLWVHARFDQQRATGLRAGLPVQIALRSQGAQPLPGTVFRIEPRADAVTEELLVKVAFTPAEGTPPPTPPIGELAEVTVALAPLPALPVLPNASIQRVEGALGVWQVVDEALRFTPVILGQATLQGEVQITQGLKGGEQVVVYSQKALSANSRISVTQTAPEKNQERKP